MEKKELRSLCHRKIKDIPKESFEEWGKAVCSLVTETQEWKKAKSVFIFVSMPTETDTSPLLKKAFAEGKRVCVPKIIGDGIMQAVEIENSAQLKPGMFGIYEPAENCRSVPKNEIELALMPCLAADEKGNRLGRGGGYYDRFCEGFNGGKFIICPEALIFKCGEIPMERWDAAADAVITEKRIIPTKNSDTE